MKTIEEQIEEAAEFEIGPATGQIIKRRNKSAFKAGATFGRELGKREGFELAIVDLENQGPIVLHMTYAAEILKLDGQRLGILPVETKE